jgi:hypothetical protein
MDNSPLNAQDRCDRCGAQALARTAHEVTATLPIYPQDTTTVTGIVPMLWCGHHFTKHRDVLTPLLVWQAPEIAQSTKTTPAHT